MFYFIRFIVVAFFAIVLVSCLSGCTGPHAYYVRDNVRGTSYIHGNTPSANVALYEKGQPCPAGARVIKKVHVSLNKSTIISKAPDKQQVDESLRDSAAALGADAVCDIIYRGGMNLFTWGYLEAIGQAVQL